MAKLTAKQRHGLEPRQFALPGGRYPINDPAHARNALARGAQNATPAEQATIKRKVRAKFPSIEVGGRPPVKKFADGGFVSSLKKAVGLGPKESLLEQTIREAAERDAKAAATPAKAAPPPPPVDTSRRRRQLDSDIERIESGKGAIGVRN